MNKIIFIIFCFLNIQCAYFQNDFKLIGQPFEDAKNRIIVVDRTPDDINYIESKYSIYEYLAEMRFDIISQDDISDILKTNQHEKCNNIHECAEDVYEEIILATGAKYYMLVDIGNNIIKINIRDIKTSKMYKTLLLKNNILKHSNKNIQPNKGDFQHSNKNIPLNKGDFQHYWRAAIENYYKQNYNEALATFIYFKSNNYNLELSTLWIGVIYYNMNNLQKAEEEFASGLLSQSADIRAWASVALGNISYRKGFLTIAHAYYKTALEEEILDKFDVDYVKDRLASLYSTNNTTPPISVFIREKPAGS